ncbi:MAG: hypothetical protein FD167_2410, partial [bacterium]
MKFDRIYKAHQLLKGSRYPITKKQFQEKLANHPEEDEVSPDTVEK